MVRYHGQLPPFAIVMRCGCFWIDLLASSFGAPSQSSSSIARNLPLSPDAEDGRYLDRRLVRKKEGCQSRAPSKTSPSHDYQPMLVLTNTLRFRHPSFLLVLCTDQVHLAEYQGCNSYTLVFPYLFQLVQFRLTKLNPDIIAEVWLQHGPMATFPEYRSNFVHPVYIMQIIPGELLV